MPRAKRRLVSQGGGSMHIISRVSGEKDRFAPDEKEFFFKLMTRFASGFFVDIHAYVIMGNHFHILATSMDQDAREATKEELLRRYKLMYGNDSEPPPGSFEVSGEIIPDEDGGIERLRQRLGSISRFVQELKQTFSRWYNERHNRKGYLWESRYKGVIVYQGLAQFVCSAYIDLNPFRAGMVQIPDDYRWSSFGLRLRYPAIAKSVLQPLTFHDSVLTAEESMNELLALAVTVNKHSFSFEWYRQFVYVAGGIEVKGKARLPKYMVEQVRNCNGILGITGALRYRIKNFSEGLAIGGYSKIAELKMAENRKSIKPQQLIKDTFWAFTTRILRL